MARITGFVDQNELEALYPIKIDKLFRSYSTSGNTFTIIETGVSNPFRFDFTGTDFIINTETDPVVRGGSITGFRISYSEGQSWIELLSVSESTLSASALQAASLTSSQDDDVQIFETIFREDDVFILSNGSNVVRAYSGNDVVNGGTGADQLYGGAGSDNISGGQGFDSLDGGEGNDLVRAGNGKDILTGGSGKDELWGGFGWNTFKGDKDGSEDLLVIKSDEWQVNSLNGKAGNNPDGSKCDIIEALDSIDKIIIQGVNTSELSFAANVSGQGLIGIGIYAKGALEALYTGVDLTVAQLTAMTTGDVTGPANGTYWSW